VIRSKDTEHVRIKLPVVQREPGEIGRLLVQAVEKSEHLRREKGRCLDEFRREEEALGAEIAGLIREQKGDPIQRHEDVACEVSYDLKSGLRILTRAMRPGHERTQAEFELDVMGQRPMTANERKAAEALAKEQT